ncbi:hypothetical protein OAW24_00500 [bacterium]|nr:hypothetical protein [bacterium]
MNLFAESKKVLDKDGKVNPLGPYGKQKLTGREISTYFRRNKITDPQIKKAVEVALDLGGAFDIAGKEIQKFYGREVRNSKEVKNALVYANESVIVDGDNLETISESAEMVIHTDDAVQSNLVVKMASKHGLKSKKTKISWSGKDGVVVSGDSNKLKKFMSAVEKISEGTVSEKYKPYLPKGSERVIDMYIQFRGNGEEKDFEKAKKMVMDYSKKHKLDIKDHPRNKVFGTPQEGSSAYKLSIYAKFTKDPNHDLAPLYKQLSTLKTAEDHGGGYAKPIKEETVSEKIEYAEYKFKNKRDAQKGLDYFKRQQLIQLDINDDGLSQGELTIDAGKKDMTKQHKEVLKMLKPKVLTTEQTISEAPKLKNLMPEFEKIVKTKGAAKVQGTMVDMFTASVIVKAYNQVNDKNKKRMETSNVFTLIKLAQKVMGLKEANLTQLKRKHKRHIDAFNKRNKDLPKKVEDELFQYAMDNDNIGDDPDDFDDWLVQNIEESVNLNEGMSKLLSPAQQKGVLKKWNEPEGSTFAKDVYSNAKIANKKDFIVTSHSVKDGDYYLSLLGNAPEGKEDKPLTKANTNMNADIRKICKKWSTAGKTSPNPAGMCFLEIERELCDKKYNNFAAADTMVREVIWGMVEDIMGIKIKTA